jgi:hypothetical protein
VRKFIADGEITGLDCLAIHEPAAAVGLAEANP